MEAPVGGVVAARGAVATVGASFRGKPSATLFFPLPGPLAPCAPLVLPALIGVLATVGGAVAALGSFLIGLFWAMSLGGLAEGEASPVKKAATVVKAAIFCFLSFCKKKQAKEMEN